MGYCQFLRDLFEDGRITVPQVSLLSDDELSMGDELMAEYESVYRLEISDPAPRFVADAGRWAGTRFFRACQFAVYRDLGERALKTELDEPYMESIDADVHYTVDLVFQYLPDLFKFAGSAAQQDPLLGYLSRWARKWPLSSVGIPGVDQFTIDGFCDNYSLMLLYADRIIQTRDKSRLSCTAARQVVQCALGMFPHLAPEINAALSKNGGGDTRP